MIGLSAITWKFPEIILTAEAYGRRVGMDEEQILSKTGISKRYFLKNGQCELPLAVEAFLKLQAKTGFSDGDIDLLVYVTQNPNRTMPHSAAQLLSQLHYRAQPASFDISLGCSAFPYALSLCRGMMETQHWNRAVVITNDPYSRLTTLDQPKTSAIFGDAATATLLERDRGGAIQLGDFGTDGDAWEFLHIPKRSEQLQASHLLDDAPVRHALSHSIRMNGTKLTSYFRKKIPESILRCLEMNTISPEAIDLLILHQASKPMLDLLRKQLPFHETTEIPVLLQDGGNTCSSSIPLTLGRIMEERSLKGQKVLITGFGVGLSWGSILLKF